MYGKDLLQNESSNYVELASQTTSLITDAYAAATEHAFGFVKSIFEITTRPYAATTVETATRENTDRFSQIANLSLVEQNSKLQETYVKTLRGAIETGVSNLNFVKETAAKQVDGMSTRIVEMQNRATSAVSAN